MIHHQFDSISLATLIFLMIANTVISFFLHFRFCSRNLWIATITRVATVVAHQLAVLLGNLPYVANLADRHLA